ncbi:type I polyketide synthase [Pseudonocardia sp. NPDC049635]|uniref:type I polyketide synthase n=1 Tax=Pseudonocardia sp. NPDC049635 TaxID=3155506 RepID=UPI0033C332B4
MNSEAACTAPVRAHFAGGTAVAVVGLACRLPGAPDPAAFWAGLGGTADALRPADSDPRGPAGPDGPPRLGLLDDVTGFDPEFFHISPREAAEIDPQQRLVLELAWEALENARIVPGALRGRAVGVFAGSMAHDHAVLRHRPDAPPVSRHTLAGLTHGIIANRVSHLLGLRGPSLTVDSAQSSSLVAAHLAAESVRRGETELALVAGVNLILTPASTVLAGRFGGLSPTGRCRVLDAGADGYARGEGGVALVLKRLDRAVADGDPVHAVLLGGAVNSGSAPAGMTVPDPDAQQDVITAALAASRVSPADIQYLEMHGTGTPVGDPVEARAAHRALVATATNRSRPLTVGSVKTRVGHLEGAAGLVGLLATVLAIRHRSLPATLNHTAPPPSVPLADWGLRVAVEPGPWPAPDEPLVAGVSSFGMGGTNCHLVVAEPPAPARPSVGTPALLPGTLMWPLSAPTPDRVPVQAGALARHLAEAAAATDRGLDPAAVGRTLAGGRTHFGHRCAVVGTADLLPGRLAALADGGPAPGTVTDRARTGGLAVLFSGQGSQRAGAGADLYRAAPAFADLVDDIAARFDALLDRPLRPLMFDGPGGPDEAALHRTRYTQPALFTLEVALYKFVAATLPEPTALLGHSIGELVAAHIAGIFDLDDAVRLVTARAAAMQDARGGGAMIAVEIDAEKLTGLLEPYGDALSLAAVNGPRAAVVAGDPDAAGELAAAVVTAGGRAKRLRVSHAFHSAHMAPAARQFRAELVGTTTRPPRIPVLSNDTGSPLTPEQWSSPDYWADHIVRTVRFHDGVRHLRGAGVAHVLEIGPTSSLIGAVRRGSDEPVTAAALLRGDAPEPEQLMTALARLHAGGVDLDWTRLLGDGPAAELPTHTFLRRAFPLPGSGAPATAASAPQPAQAPHSRTGTESGPSTADRPAATYSTGQVLRRLLGELAVVLGHEGPTAIDPDRAFVEAGLDSLGAVELRDRLSAALGVTLPSGVVFENPTPRLLARRIHGADDRTDLPCTPGSAADDDPVVIVGAAGRWPGADCPTELFQLAVDGVDRIGPFPTDRGWDLAALHRSDPAATGGSYVAGGGFLDDVARFDAAAFGISPREATAMDPQQRILLELCRELTERAGIDPDVLRGAGTGVFVGVSPGDYGPRLHRGDPALDGYLLTGSAPSVASGRIAYHFGFEGPALTVDTACSSSLVALHLAVRALRAGECQTAVAGGAAVMATPGMFVEFSRQRGLAPDGRCKPFAAAADGTAWGEGAGLVLLQRRSRARRDGRRVLAVVRGSAINSDGASNGLTAPNGSSQRQVIRAALADAGLTGADVDAVEAHGTGTRLGDPIEADALIDTYGCDRPVDQPVLVGSVKSNIGHTQAAAGITGLITMMQALDAGVLPGTLHLDSPTPNVDWSRGAVRVRSTAEPWPETGRSRRAAVSAFGISGTNAHVVIEQGDPPVTDVDPGPAPAPPHPVGWPLSGPDAAGLRTAAADLAGWLQDHPHAAAADVAATLAVRSADTHRAVVVVEDPPGGLAALRAFAAEGHHPSVAAGTATSGRTVFVLPGQGSQWPGMARELLAAEPVFAEHLHECARHLVDLDGPPLLPLVTDPDADLTDSALVQPALFAVCTGLAQVWRAHGVHPDSVVGHSQGEVAAAWVAGALPLPEALRVVVARSRALAGITGSGAMLATMLPASELAARIAEFGGGLDVAVVNGPNTTVAAGDTERLAEFAGWLADAGVRVRPVAVDYASHSAHVDRIEVPLRAGLVGVRPVDGETAFYSTVRGTRIDTTELDADYWYDNMRRTVRFDAAVRALLADGHDLFVELSPHPSLGIGIEEIAATDHPDLGAVVTGSLRRDEGGRARLMHGLAAAHVAGRPVDWSGLLPVEPAPRPLPLPARRPGGSRYWVAPDRADRPTSGGHPFLGTRTTVAGRGTEMFVGRISVDDHPWLTDHAVGDTVLLPGTGMLELAAYAAGESGFDEIAELTLQAPLQLRSGRATEIQVSVITSADDPGRAEVEVHARPAPTADETEPMWTRHAGGWLTRDATGSVPAGPPTPAPPWPPAGAEPIDVESMYDDLDGRGYRYGPTFRRVLRAWRHGTDLLAEIDGAPGDPAGPDGLLLHPAVSDAALHPLVAAPDGAAGVLLPFSWSGCRLRPAGATVRATVRRSPDGSAVLDLTGGDGTPVLSAAGLALRPVSPDVLGDVPPPAYRVSWSEVAATPGAAPGHVVIVPDPAALAALDPTARAGLVLVPLPPPAGGSPAGRVRETAELASRLVQEWFAADPMPGARLVLVTSGAVAVTEGEQITDPGAAAAWGLVRAALRERPGILALLDVDPGATGAPRPPAVLGDPEISEVAVRGDRVHVPRLAVLDTSDLTPAGGPRLRPDGTTLVTGGTGVLGLLTARRLAERHGARHLLLVGRRASGSEGAAELTRELAGRGVQVRTADCDVTDPDALTALIAAIPPEHPLDAVVHAAGVLDDAMVPDLTAERLRAAIAPKSDAAWTLHEATAGLELSAFVLFSSVVGVLGNAGQAGYAAANAALDALAVHRAAHGLPATSVAWGLWETDTGMTGGMSAADVSRMRRGGVAPMSPENGLALLDRALGEPVPTLVAARLTRADEPMLRGLFGTPARQAPAPPGPDLATMAPEARREALLGLVTATAAELLGHTGAGDVDPRRPFTAQGFDSLVAVEFRNRLGARLGIALPVMLTFNYPTPEELAEHLGTRFAPTRPDPTAELDRIEQIVASLSDEDWAGPFGSRLAGLARSWASRGSAGDIADPDTSSIGDLVRLLDHALAEPAPDGAARRRPGESP